MIFTPEMVAERVRLAQGFEAADNAAFGHGGFLLDMVVENTRIKNFFYGDWLGLWGAVGWWIMMSLTMLIGLLAGRRRWVQRAPDLMPQIRRLTWLALAVVPRLRRRDVVDLRIESHARTVADQGAG